MISFFTDRNDFGGFHILFPNIRTEHTRIIHASTKHLFRNSKLSNGE